VEYLGHIVSKEGVRVDTTKIEAIQNWPQPISIKQLRAFLSLPTFYRKFIKHFAMIVAPLVDLLKHDNFS